MSGDILYAEWASVGYEGNVIVPDVSVSLPAGKSLALTGINGSGKTTLLKTIAGLIPLVSGKLAVFGEAPVKARPRIAYLGQSNPASFLLPLRAIDVVRMSRFADAGLLRRLTKEDERTVRESMEFMGIEKAALDPLNTLSGGQRQRVFLAYVLARKAGLVLLDEPTSGLDIPGTELYKKAVARMLAGGASVVIATHNIKEAAGCDQAILLAQRVVVYGPGRSVLTPETLLATFGIIARFENGNVVVVEKDHGCENCP